MNAPPLTTLLTFATDAGPAAQAPARGVTVAGMVEDQTGASSDLEII